jgi:hypothetical protein
VMSDAPAEAAPPPAASAPAPTIVTAADDVWGSHAGHLQGDQWEVQALLQRRTGRYRRTEYLVRWLGWDARFDEWVPAREIGCELVRDFEEREAAAAAAAAAGAASKEVESVVDAMLVRLVCALEATADECSRGPLNGAAVGV